MKKYLKGSLHNHTTVSDGNLDPQTAAEYIKNLGYDFMVFTDHNKNYSIDGYIKEPIKNFVCLSGSEYDSRTYNYFGNHSDVHVIGIGHTGSFSRPDTGTIPEKIEYMIKQYKELGAVPMVNHPNWGGSRFGYSFNYTELLNVNESFLMEIFNYSDGGYNEGNIAFESHEYIWDVLLSNGKTVYGTMTDDAHVYAEKKDWYKDAFNVVESPFIKVLYDSFMKCHTPGNGFIMVKADKNEESIKEALKKGDFYASNGLIIDNYDYNDKYIEISLKTQNNENNRIIFKGRMGIPLKIVDGNKAVYEFKNIPDEEYVRVKVINGGSKCALFQPIFRDGRNNVL